MKYEFDVSFSWENGCCSWNPDSFYAKSSDEVCNKVKDIMHSDPDGYNAEDFFIEGYTTNEAVGRMVFEYMYETKLRDNKLCDEENQMFESLKNALKGLFDNE